MRKYAHGFIKLIKIGHGESQLTGMAVIQCYVASSSIFNTVAIWTLKIFFLELVSLSDKYLIIFLLSIQSHFCGNHHPWQTMPIQMAIWELMVTRMLLRHIHGNVYAP